MDSSGSSGKALGRVWFLEETYAAHVLADNVHERQTTLLPEDGDIRLCSSCNHYSRTAYHSFIREKHDNKN